MTGVFKEKNQMSKNRDLFIRARTAVVFVIVMFAGIYFSVYGYLALMAFIMLASINEFQNVMKPIRPKDAMQPYYKGLSFVLALLFFGASYGVVVGQLPAKLLLVFPSLLFLFFVMELFALSKNPFPNVAINVLGWVYLCVPFAVLNFVCIREVDYVVQYQYKLVLAILFLIWANDSCAYLVGSRIGKHKMMPRISPGKTWEGIVGGIVGAAVVAVLLHNLFNLHFLNMTDWIIIGIIASIAATFGDLVESMMKRSLGIKDTGTLMPGHGGILDRFDAFYFAVPFVALYLALVGKI